MAKTHAEEYENARKALHSEADAGQITDADLDAFIEFLNAKDPDRLSVVDHTDDSPKEPATLAQYAYTLKFAARHLDVPLTEASADELNAFFSGLLDGSHPGVKDDGYAKGTVRSRQGHIRKFYRFHDDLGVSPEDIAMLTPQETSVDERDVFDDEDVQALREACENSRDRCLVELLLYTGQRIGALLTLRVKDVDPDQGVFWLNDEADGLKHADERGLKRPLLGAKAAVREWLQYHPTGDPDDYLLTCLPGKGTAQGTPGDRLHYTSVKERLDKIGERADVDKPVNAHNFRHYFATVAKRDYDLDSDTVKFLLGHAKDSTVMEATYAHLTNEDYITKARAARGEIDPSEESSLTPPECPTCQEPLADDAKACPSCGMVFTPDAQAAKDQVQQDVGAEKALAELEEAGDLSPEQVEALADDGELLAKLIEARAERSG